VSELNELQLKNQHKINFVQLNMHNRAVTHAMDILNNNMFKVWLTNRLKRLYYYPIHTPLYNWWFDARTWT